MTNRAKQKSARGRRLPLPLRNCATVQVSVCLVLKCPLANPGPPMCVGTCSVTRSALRPFFILVCFIPLHFRARQTEERKSQKKIRVRTERDEFPGYTFPFLGGQVRGRAVVVSSRKPASAQARSGQVRWCLGHDVPSARYFQILVMRTNGGSPTARGEIVSR